LQVINEEISQLQSARSSISGTALASRMVNRTFNLTFGQDSMTIFGHTAYKVVASYFDLESGSFRQTVIFRIIKSFFPNFQSQFRVTITSDHKERQPLTFSILPSSTRPFKICSIVWKLASLMFLLIISFRFFTSFRFVSSFDSLSNRIDRLMRR
jgi:hypothetical protein